VPSKPPPSLVPDTLDLADHGRLAINGMLGSLNPQLDYESTFLNILDVHPAYMLHWSSMVSGVMPKYVEALPMLRSMSGSEQDRDLEAGFFDSVLRNTAGDGLIYDQALPGRPWNVGVFYGKPDWNEDYANMAGNGRLLSGLIFCHQASGDPLWLERARRTAERMLELAVVEGNLAWYPNPGCGNDFSYPRRSGWTTRLPPQSANEGFEGGAMFYQLQPLRGFIRYYNATGDERFLDLARRFARLGMQEKFWAGAGDMAPLASAERGHFRLHFHASMAGVRGILDYALAANDYAAREWAHNAYLYARQVGIQRLGLFPTNTWGTEGCSIADMIGMAIALSDGGMGDYWDDVEMYVRNGLVSAQATDLDELRRVSEEGLERPPCAAWGGVYDLRFNPQNNRGCLPGQEIHERVLERTLGAFGFLIGARFLTPMMMHCCTANGSQGLYYAWEGIVRREGAGAVVNLWLNRRTPWLDVWSHLPHEGRLELRNKTLGRLEVRQPAWTQRSQVRCQVDGNPVDPDWRGNRLVLEGLRGGEQITIQAPLNTETARLTLVGIADPHSAQERYEIEFKGHTALGVKLVVPPSAKEDAWPGQGERTWYRLFRREALRSPQAPLKPAPDYVHPEKLVHWTVT
jgi:hypothetical protein